jgi:hypothetical protein
MTRYPHGPALGSVTRAVGQTSVGRIEPHDPRTLSRWEHGPTHHCHVVFWRQPQIPPEAVPAGATQDQVIWAAQENDVLDVPRCGESSPVGWMAPHEADWPHHERRQPPEMNPTHGIPSEVYRGPDEGSTGPMFTAGA